MGQCESCRTDKSEVQLSEPDIVAVNYESKPTLLTGQRKLAEGFKEIAQATKSNAESGFQSSKEKVGTTMLATKESAQVGLRNTVQGMNDRVAAAWDGQRMVAEGGEATEAMLLAKDVAIKAVAADQSIVEMAPLAVDAFGRSAAKLRLATGPVIAGITNSDDFLAFADASEARALLYQRILGMLKKPASALPMSTAEKDALKLLQAKVSCKSVASTIYDSFQGGIRHVPLRGKEIEDASPQTKGFLRDLQATAQATLEATGKAINDRFDVAKGGKAILDAGGEPALFAKRACMDASSCDADFVQRVHAIIPLYEEAAKMFKHPDLKQEVNGVTLRGVFGKLGQDYEARAKLYKQLSVLLKEPLSSLPLSDPEQDALAALQARETITDGAAFLKTRAAAGAEVVKSRALSSTGN